MFQDIILARHEGLIILPRIIISAVSGLRVITGYHPVSGVRRNNLTNDPVVPPASDARDPKENKERGSCGNGRLLIHLY